MPAGRPARRSGRPCAAPGGDDGRAGAVAEKDGSRPVFPVDHPRYRFSSHYQDIVAHAAGNRPRRHGQGVDEAGAPGRNIKGSRVDATAAVSDARRRRRHYLVGRDARGDHEVDLPRFNTRVGQSFPRREYAKVGGAHARLGYPPLGDARSLPDPFIGRIEAGSQIVVGHHLAGHVGAEADNGHRSPQEGDRAAMGHRLRLGDREGKDAATGEFRADEGLALASPDRASAPRQPHLQAQRLTRVYRTAELHFISPPEQDDLPL